MQLYPFVFQEKNGTIRNSQNFDCFDEASPCVLEQISACVIKNSASQSDLGQSKFVPWLICMDTDGETKADAQKCSQQVGIDYTAVDSCVKTQGPALLQQLLKEDAKVHQTPTVYVGEENIGGKQGPSFESVKAAICKSSPTLKGCTGEEGMLVV